MKKLLVLGLIAMFSVVLVSCGQSETFEIALVTDVGNIDDKSFNEGAWNGVIQYAEANDKTYAYYRPTEDSNAARVEQIEAAIEKGAKIVVVPGYLFETAIYEVQGNYPEVSFLLLDGTPQVGDYATYFTAENTHNVLYQEEQAGFLAGYAAVMEGYRELGFVGGMDVPAVVRYGFGYVQGADYAAAELELTAGDVNISYYYAGAFAPSPDLETKMDLWYNDADTPLEVIFACGGKLYLSVVASAENFNGEVIGVDVDQHAESTTIITSAMKGLTTSVVDSLTAFYNNDMEWPSDYAGETAVLGAANDGVGLPTNDDAWRFENFTVAQYNTIFAKLIDGSVLVSNDIANQPTVTLVTVDYVE